jgi:AAA+ superfamily predicted ATPase
MAELKRIDLGLRLQVEHVRQRLGRPGSDEFRGLYISEDEIDALVSGEGSAHAYEEPSAASDSPLAALLRRVEGEIAQKKEGSLGRGVVLRLHELRERFGLCDFEVDTLLICLLPEIDSKYERLYAYLHDDVTRKRPSVNLVLQCLLGTLDDRLAARHAFLPQAPLLAYHLLRVEDDSTARPAPLLTRNVKIEDRVVNYLLDSDQLDPRLAECVRLIDPVASVSDMVLAEGPRERLEALAGSHHDGGDVLYLQGFNGVGKKTAVEALCHARGFPVLMVDIAGLVADELSLELGIALVCREARLQGAALCWDRLDLLISDDRMLRACLERVVEETGRFAGPVFATGEASWQPGSALGKKTFAQIELPLPSYDERKQLWDSYLNGYGPGASGTDLGEIADKFRFTPGQIQDAAAAARNLATCRGDAEISSGDLYSTCRAVSNQKLGMLARKIRPKFIWGDIVLPRDQMAQLREIANYVKYRHVVFADWEFEHKLSLGRGLNVLFAGPSGTGKTMAAEIIGGELGLDLYKVDLSTVVSKYIGETEKNLDRIFTEAQSSNAILFFDEADAIFGKRSEVRDSHDRYANIEVAYLLQKMEEYDGIVILATNLRKNLDEAFARRMHFSVEFPLPEEPDRHRIWKGVFPCQAPLSENVDLGFMARQFKITGGNIKNIALGAAFLAAENGGTIGMEHVIWATKREYQKIGRLCTEGDFGTYFNLVKV